MRVGASNAPWLTTDAQSVDYWLKARADARVLENSYRDVNYTLVDSRVLENSYRDVNYTLVDSHVLENSYRDVNYTLVDFVKKT